MHNQNQNENDIPIDGMTKDSPFYKKIYNDLVVQEKSYNMWYDFTQNTQLQRINTYLNGNLQYVQNEAYACENHVNNLDDLDQQLMEVKDIEDDQRYNLEYVLQEKQRQSSTLNDRMNEAQQKVDQIVQQHEDKGKERDDIKNEYKDEFLISLVEPITPIMNELLKMYNFLFYESDELVWSKFKQISFGDKADVKQQQQPQQQDNKEDNSEQPKPPQLQIQVSSKQEQQIPLQKKQKSLFESKLTHLKTDELTDAKIDKLQNYLSNKKIVDSDEYTKNTNGFKILFDWLKTLSEENDLLKKQEFEQMQLQKVYKDLDDEKKRFNIEFDQQTLKFYHQGIEEIEAMRKTVAASRQCLVDLKSLFEYDTANFFHAEADAMQAIIDQLQNQLNVPNDLYK